MPLLLAALPAVIVCLTILHLAGAPRALALQQGLATAAGAALILIVRNRRGCATVLRWRGWPPLLASTLFLPLLHGGHPSRWVPLSGFRLYLAALAIPPFLFLWHLAASRRALPPAATVLCLLLPGLALTLQPDAAQLTAFAAAAGLLAAAAPLRPILKGGTIALLLAGAIAAWRLPDPLAPVPWVEGVFRIAAATSPGLLLLAVLAAAAPVLTLARIAASARNSSLAALAAYYGTLYALSPLQVTPVPLLGFGLGPLLGYLLLSCAVAGTARDAPA